MAFAEESDPGKTAAADREIPNKGRKNEVQQKILLLLVPPRCEKVPILLTIEAKS